MALSEIEKLERRYAENPQGLTFAPLAEVHRKNGEVQRALDLLGPGLQIHPDYIPASIVLGRCHMDLGDVHKAETAFLHVLALDGENVIALKALADISERLLRFDDAERWLNTLLLVDRSNDEAREQLQRVEISRRQAGVASSAEPASLVEEAKAEATVAGAESANVAPPAAFEPPAPESPLFEPPRFEPPLAEPSLGWVSHASNEEPSEYKASDLSAMEDLEPSAFRGQFDEPAPVEPLDGLVGREVDTPDVESSEFQFETSEDIILQSAGGSEFQMPDASLELSAGGAQGSRGPFEEDLPMESFGSAAAPPEPRAEPPAPEPPAPEPVAPEPAAPEPVAEEPVPPIAAHFAEPEPVPVAEPEPYAPAPVEELAPSAPEPEPEAAVPVGGWERRAPAAPSPAPAAPKRAYGVGETGGSSVVQLFQGILSARPPLQASAPVVRPAATPAGSGAPTRPAADSLSLSSVFGEEAPASPPAMPASGSDAGAVTFDDFFGSSNASPAARTTRAPDPKNDDLDQFHAWLQNLKR